MCKDLELGAVSFDRNNIIPKDIPLHFKNIDTFFYNMICNLKNQVKRLNFHIGIGLTHPGVI